MVKSNIALPAPSLVYSVEGLPETNAPSITWRGASDHTADSLVSAPPTREEDTPTRREEARAFLRTALADGPKPAKELLREGEQCGISKWTLRDAKYDLDVKSDRIDGIADKGAWQWFFSPASA